MDMPLKTTSLLGLFELVSSKPVRLDLIKAAAEGGLTVESRRRGCSSSFSQACDSFQYSVSRLWLGGSRLLYLIEQEC